MIAALTASNDADRFQEHQVPDTHFVSSSPVSTPRAPTRQATTASVRTSGKQGQNSYHTDHWVAPVVRAIRSILIAGSSRGLTALDIESGITP